MNLFIEYLDSDCPKLAYQSERAAGLDLPAAVNPDHTEGSWSVDPFQTIVIDIPIKIAIPAGHYGRVVMRSGHGFNRDLFCHVGTIDADYRGPVKVKLFNFSRFVQTIKPYERFAQLIVQPYLQAEICLVADVASYDPTARGEAGFGSTGGDAAANRYTLAPHLLAGDRP